MATKSSPTKRSRTFYARAAVVVGAIAVAIPGGTVLASSIDVRTSPQPFSATITSVSPPTSQSPPQLAATPPPPAPTSQPPTSIPASASAPAAVVEPAKAATGVQSDEVSPAEDSPTPTPSTSESTVANPRQPSQPASGPSTDDTVVGPDLAWTACEPLAAETVPLVFDCVGEVSLHVSTVGGIGADPEVALIVGSANLVGKVIVVGWSVDGLHPQEVARTKITAVGETQVPLPSPSDSGGGYWRLAML